MNTLVRAALVLVLSNLTPLMAQDRESKPMNVVFVLVDDLGWTDLTCQGSEFYATPNIDRLAASGIRFTDAYAAPPWFGGP